MCHHAHENLMFLQNLKLKNFRNYSSLEAQFHPRFNLIIGKNAQGKTNILEAVYYLSALNSFRSSEKAELIHNQEAAALLEACVVHDGLERSVKIILERDGRKVELNGKKPSPLKNYFGVLPLILFEPKEVYLLRETPSCRRKYLNRAVFLDVAIVAELVRRYDEVITQKNKLLKEGAPQVVWDMIPIWNQKLMEIGTEILMLRLSWFDRINPLLPEEYRKIVPTHEDLRLVFEPSVDVGDEREKNSIEKLFHQALEERKTEEIRRRESLVGPHRDNWQAFLGNRLVASLGSQGENRSAIIALKSAQVKLFEKEHGHPPVFLLDDVGSELDLGRLTALLGYLRETHGQVFLSTTEPESLSRFFGSDGLSFMVEEGKVAVLG